MEVHQQDAPENEHVSPVIWRGTNRDHSGIVISFLPPEGEPIRLQLDIASACQLAASLTEYLPCFREMCAARISEAIRAAGPSIRRLIAKS